MSPDRFPGERTPQAQQGPQAIEKAAGGGSQVENASLINTAEELQAEMFRLARAEAAPSDSEINQLMSRVPKDAYPVSVQYKSGLHLTSSATSTDEKGLKYYLVNAIQSTRTLLQDEFSSQYPEQITLRITYRSGVR